MDSLAKFLKDDTQGIFVVLVIPTFLTLMLILEGVKNLMKAKNVGATFSEGLDDEAFLSGRQAGILGFFYILFGVLCLLAIGYVFLRFF